MLKFTLLALTGRDRAFSVTCACSYHSNERRLSAFLARRRRSA